MFIFEQYILNKFSDTGIINIYSKRGEVSRYVRTFIYSNRLKAIPHKPLKIRKKNGII